MITATAVSRFLGRTHRRSTPATRDVLLSGAGFEVTKIGYGDDRGKILVGYNIGDRVRYMTRKRQVQVTAEKLAAFTETLSERYTVTEYNQWQIMVTDKEK